MISAAPSRTVDAYSRTACRECGALIEQVSEGRPRTICGAHECELARNRRAKEKRTGFTHRDWREALSIWRGACAWCGTQGGLKRSRYHLAPLPTCRGCNDADAQLRAPREALQRVGYYIGNAHPGVPLPRPFVRFPEGE